MEAAAPLSLGDLVPSFYTQEFETVRTFIENSRTRPGTHLAVIGDSDSGREEFVQRIVQESTKTVTHISLSHPANREHPLAVRIPETSLLVIGNAHYLASRTIGGFSSLDEFVSLIAEQKQTVISSWNTHAWNYFTAAVNLDKTGTETVHLPPVPGELLREAVLSHYRHAVTCINDATLRESVFASSKPRTIRLPFTSKKVKIPWFTIDWNLIRSAFKRRKDEISPEDVVFSRLDALSGGNPGVAITLWNKGFQYPEIRVSRIQELPALPDLSFDERFILVNLLMMESLEAKELVRVAGSTATPQDILRLMNEQVLEDTEGQIRIPPLMTKPIAEYLRGLRMVI